MADVGTPPAPQQPETHPGDPRTKDEKEVDAKLAERLSVLIEEANERVVPLVKMVRQVRFPNLCSECVYECPIFLDRGSSTSRLRRPKIATKSS